MEVQNLWQTMEKGKMDKQMKIAVVGVGLIGGSFALTLKEKGLAAEVVGVGLAVHGILDRTCFPSTQ